MMFCNSVKSVRRFLENYHWLRRKGYGRREAWHWAGRTIQQ